MAVNKFNLIVTSKTPNPSKQNNLANCVYKFIKFLQEGKGGGVMVEGKGGQINIQWWKERTGSA